MARPAKYSGGIAAALTDEELFDVLAFGNSEYCRLQGERKERDDRGTAMQTKKGDIRKKIYRHHAEKIRKGFPGWKIKEVIPKIQKIVEKGIQSDDPKHDPYKKLYPNKKVPCYRTVSNAISDLFD